MPEIAEIMKVTEFKGLDKIITPTLYKSVKIVATPLLIYE